MRPGFVDLPQDIYHHILSANTLGVLDIIALKQTCRALRMRLASLLVDHPAIYREKLDYLAKDIPTGLPKDLSAFTSQELETAALSAYAVEQRWRCDCPNLSRPPRFFTLGIDTDEQPVARAVKVLPGGRWIIAGLDDGNVSIWDTVKEEIVAHCNTGCGLDDIELEITREGETMLVITGTYWNSEAMDMFPRPSLSVYSVKLDPPPTSRNDSLFSLKGRVVSPRHLYKPAIKGPLTCATADISPEALGILVYDWQMDAGNILMIDYTTLHDHASEEPPSLAILPHAIVLFVRPLTSPILYCVKVPELQSMSQDLEDSNEAISSSRLPPRIAAVPEVIEWQTSHHKQPSLDSSSVIPFKCRIVEHPSSTSTSMYLTSVAIKYPHVMVCDRMTVKFSSDSFSVTYGEHLTHNVLIADSSECEWDLDNFYVWPQVVVLGHTGRRAIWVATTGQNRRGLIGFTAPTFIDSDGWGEELQQQSEPELFSGNSLLRRLLSFPVRASEESDYIPRVIRTLGFDESTTTVAVGDAHGRVWVLNYGPRNAVRG